MAVCPADDDVIAPFLTGLQPSSKGARVKFAGPRVTVIDGPFAETKN